ncbi:uncharacterized protein LOC121725272 [Aricia agestis]|uniref:uncharacterized protein LOC121725272 n=1 Tax=Aricia agestis TaxID=91739 RepID=UPI001C201D1D|nr:uncharacterized protein LOC121725272 [Aricia agestis]
MQWILLCLLPVVFAIDIDYYDDTLLRARDDDDSVCIKWKRDDCAQRCRPDYSVCIGNVCFCLSLTYGEDKNILRHHIAHFCPSIDKAKQCIFKCMKSGQPAFCGKDNVCYCGHRYTPMDDNSKNNTKAAYSQFRELYQKYFGPNYADDYEVI